MPLTQPADVLHVAQHLWHEGRFAEARILVREARARGNRNPRIGLAAWAFDERFSTPISGRHVELVRRSPADVRLVREAWADRAFMDRFHRLASELPQDDAALSEILAKEARSTLLDTRALHWTIVTDNGKARVGMVSFVDFSVMHRRAEFIIGVRGAAAGVALEAALVALEFAFNSLRLHKVMASVYGSNEYALRSIRHLGFQREALLREHVRDPRTGEYVDLCQLALFPQDFISPSNQRLANRLLGRALQVPASPA